MRPRVGLLHNPAVTRVVAHAPALVEYLEVMPDRLWHDFGDAAGAGRFVRAAAAVDLARRTAGDRPVGGHGLGLSLPSDLALDAPMLDAVGGIAHTLGFGQYSEHLSVFRTARGSVPGAQAGLGLPVDCGAAAFAVLAPKLATVRDALGVPLALENNAHFAPLPDMAESEPAFLSRLYRTLGCDTLLDLHNLHVAHRNGGSDPEAWLAAIDPCTVTEIHLAGGDEMFGFYSDSHCGRTPDVV